MWLTEKERMTASILGVVSLAALGLLMWRRQSLDFARDAALSVVEGRQQKPPLVIEPALEQTAQWDAALVAARQVDVNTATAAELERLPGVGPTLAQRIVEYRTTHGRFHTPADLQQVQGIGPKTYEELRDHVTTH